MRVRSFRNVIIFTAVLLGMLAVTVAAVGFLNPDLLPLCFEPDGTVVCPTAQTALSTGTTTGQPSTADIDDAISQTAGPWDATVVEFVGLLGATIAAATALRRSRDSVDPYSLPVALAVLKVTTGALTAFLGILLVRAQFIPGLSALDSSAQIIAWSVVLGYAQQLFTRAVDQQAQTLLAQTVSSPPRTAPPPQATMLPDHAGAAPVSQTETPRSGTKGLMSRLRAGPAQRKG
jgi:hypothetical protein